MTYLNPDLHEALGNCFGHVHVTNAGSPAAYEVRIDLDSYASDRPRGFIEWRDWGETYSVNCPECGDARGRFYVGHMWGVFCPRANRRVFSCTKCWNEDCKVDLFDILRGGPRLQVHALQEARSGAHRRMELPGDPQDLTPVNRLPASHPAAQYLAGRGFDLDLLSDEYGFVYCSRSPWKKSVQDGAGNWHLVTPENRIIIPNIQQGTWQGWMARYLGEVPKDPVTGKPVVQKYLNAPGYSMGTTVYRLDEAAAFSGGSFCLVCEGAMSAIACGAAGVATFGLYPRPMQEELLASRFRNGRIVFLVESEAAANGRVYGCIERLRKQVAEGCATVLLDAGKDAANLDSDALLGMIENALGGSGASQ